MSEAKRGRGRPRSITPEQRAAVMKLLAVGHNTSRACELAGVSRRTWYRERART